MDWLRLFDSTAFFIRLMMQTIASTRFFMIIMIIWYMTFGTAFYILNLSSKSDDDDFVPDMFGVWFLDAFSS